MRAARKVSNGVAGLAEADHFWISGASNKARAMDQHGAVRLENPSSQNDDPPLSTLVVRWCGNPGGL
jgi:hypothetical protein